MVRLNFFTLFRLELGIRNIDVEIEKEIKLSDLLYLAEKKANKKFVHKLIDNNGNLLSSAIILVNGKNVHHLQKLETVIKDGDELALFPPGGGG